MKLLVFGTGDYYQRYKKWFVKEEVVALLDNSPAKQHTVMDGIEVISPREGISKDFDAVIILSFYVKAMRQQLLELGVPEGKIYHFFDLNRLICHGNGGQDIDYKKPMQYYGGAERIEPSSTILLLSHDLTMGGPALALYHMGQALRRQGNKIAVASMLDGPLREILVQEGIPVIVDVNLQVETMCDAGWLDKFRLIVCNTINFHVFLSERNTDTPVLWWLHDSAFFYDGVNPDVLRAVSSEKMEVCAVGPVARKAMESYRPDLLIEDLLYGVTDEAELMKRKGKDGDKVRFVTIGYIEARKGQDILIQALREMPGDVRKRAEFIIVGQDTSLLAGKIRKEIKDIPETVMTGVLDREKIHELLGQADALVCPSREDPMPTVAAEAMMHGVPCILSDATGTAGYMQDGVDGIVFHSEDARSLAEKLVRCIEHPKQLSDMGMRARKVYENVFSMQVFEENVRNVLLKF